MKSISQRVAQKLKEEGPSYDSASGPKDRTRKSESPEQQQAKDIAYGGGGGVKGGTGGRKEADRTKKDSEIIRKKAVGGGKFEPVRQKIRKDAGESRTGKAGGAVLPKGERGAANVPLHQQSREQKKAAYLAKKAAQARGEKIGLSQSDDSDRRTKSETGTGDKKVRDQASKILQKDKPAAKKRPEAAPGYKPREHSGYSRNERANMVAKGERKLKNIMKDQEKEKAKKSGEGRLSKSEINKRVKARWK